MLSKIVATSLVSFCLATVSLAQSGSPNGADTDPSPSSPASNQNKSAQGDDKSGASKGQDTSRKMKADSRKNSGGCNNQANSMTSTSANQDQAGSQSCD
ncbi:hypothetical protein [Rhizobium sp. RCC_161_2]|uniref:hypothetical protein n=1 Tax=Rhizobium sp. RCC_161_2 TaxID=3239219 RepID=UPI003523D1D4